MRPRTVEPAECASLDEYPHVARPRVHTVGMRPTSTRSTLPPEYARRLRPLVAGAQPRSAWLDRRREFTPNHDHGRDRAGCSLDHTASVCSRPGRNRTGDLRIQPPASLASGDSGARRSRSYRCGDAYQRLLVRSARAEPPVRPTVRNERRPYCREPHPVHSPDAWRQASHWMKAGDNPVFASPGRVVRVGARLCG